MEKVKIGVIGCGQISKTYLRNLTKQFDHLEVIACADVVPELAQQRAQEYGISLACSPDALLQHPEIEIVVNLTSPKAHGPVNLQALEAGKHVYVEKPITVTREEAKAVNELAKKKGLLVGVAPDTILGAGLQTVRKMIDDGFIGTPYAARGMILMENGSNSEHPNIGNFFKVGGEPLFDMGPYFITAMVSLFGSVRRVTGSAQQLHKEITLTNPNHPKFGSKINVEMPTNVSAILDFHSGVVGNLTVAKESFGYNPNFEIYGTEGILYASDPNMFARPLVVLQKNGEKVEVPYTHGFTEDSRGLGVADMAHAIRTGEKHRANGELGYHVLDVMHSIYQSSEEEQHVSLESSCERPEPLPSKLKQEGGIASP
jgi:predicted dehydrogenase